MIGSWLIVSMNDESIKEVYDLDNLTEIQNALDTNSHAKNFQYKSKLNNLKKGNMSTMEYTTRIKEIVRKLVFTGYHVNEEDQVYTILNGLDYNYDMLEIIQSKLEPISVREL